MGRCVGKQTVNRIHEGRVLGLRAAIYMPSHRKTLKRYKVSVLENGVTVLWNERACLRIMWNFRLSVGHPTQGAPPALGQMDGWQDGSPIRDWVSVFQNELACRKMGLITG